MEQDIEDVEEKDIVSPDPEFGVFATPMEVFVFEICCGCALLTRMWQARGYLTCEPLDLSGGWNVFDSKHGQKVQEILDRENPYLLARLAMPLFSVWVMVEYGPGSGRQWLPVLGWIRDLVRKQHNKDGKSLPENPKPSAAWNTKDLMDLEVMNPHLVAYHTRRPPSLAPIPLVSRTRSLGSCAINSTSANHWNEQIRKAFAPSKQRVGLRGCAGASLKVSYLIYDEQLEWHSPQR